MGHQWGHHQVTYRVGLHPQQVQYTVDEAVGRTFDYVEGTSAARLLAPPLGYVAPELIASNGASAPPPLSPASDMFSLGARQQVVNVLLSTTSRQLHCSKTAFHLTAAAPSTCLVRQRWPQHIRSLSTCGLEH